MINIFFLTPEMFLATAGLIILIGGTVLGEKHIRFLFHLGIISSAAALGMVATQNAGAAGLGSMWIMDPSALLFKALVLVCTILTLMMSFNYTAIPLKHTGAYTALLLWASAGMMALSGAMDFIYLLLSLELISLSCFILTGFEARNQRSSEGAIKYFLIGALSTAVTVYGISLFYGATGTTSLINPASDISLHVKEPMYLMSLLFILVGFGFKVSIVPFHFWVPDAYEGAPTPVTAYLSVASKLAALGAMLRVFTAVIPHQMLGFGALIALLAALTMTLGNLAALYQSNVKRLLAYSSIAQAGYMLIGLVVADDIGREGVMLYAIAYLAANMGAFAVSIVVAARSGSYELDGYNGLAKRSFGLSLIMAMFLLSLAGIPPMAGFVGKFYVFASAVNAPQYLWLAVLGVINSVISVYYYMKITHRMFFTVSDDTEPVRTDLYMAGVLAFTAALTLVIGILPQTFIQAVKACIAFRL